MIFVALPIRHIRRVLDLIDELRDTTASIYYVPDILVFDLIQSRTQEILGIPVIAMLETPFAGYRGVVKRMTDIVLCLSGVAAAAADHGGDLGGGEAFLARTRDLPAAALRPRRAADRGLQVPHHERHRGRRL